MNSQPKIKAVFESWKLQGGTKETFLSNLQKNQEVKNIILSESPWVLEAQTEEQQKERIATLFDLNNIRSNNIAALTRLQELQNSNGAWSWYKGMNGSRSVTTYIAELNARLTMLTGEKLTGTDLSLQQNAFTYLHQSALDKYKEILKAQKEGVKFVPYISGFFITIPVTNSQAVCDILEKDHVFMVPLKKGIRLAVCSVSKKKMHGLAHKLALAIKEAGAQQ